MCCAKNNAKKTVSEQSKCILLYLWELCGKKQRQNINPFVKTAYFAYFGIKLGDQDKPWAPHTVCSVCIEDLRNWTKGKKKALRFGIPMVWRQPINHIDDCYFCMCSLKGFNTKNKKEITYPNLPSAIRPVPHGPDIFFQWLDSPLGA
jgi:hypothetical protein